MSEDREQELARCVALAAKIVELEPTAGNREILRDLYREWAEVAAEKERGR